MVDIIKKYRVKKVYIFIFVLTIAFIVGREINHYQLINHMKLEYKRLVKEKLVFGATEEILYSLPKGFGSDTLNLYRAKLNQDDADRIIVQAESDWYKFPFSEELQLYMYGGYKDRVHYSHNFAARVGLPVIESGYWKLISNQSIELRKDFSLFIFDTNTNILYLFQSRY